MRLQGKDKGALLEDVTAKIFRNWGFQVQPRLTLTDDAGATHEIDVYATKDEPFGKVTIAAECKNVSTPIGIEDLRNFQVKLSRLNISKGIFISTSGFTTGATEFAKSAAIELWDDATIWKKAGKEPESQLIENTIPLRITSLSEECLPSIRNADRYIKLKPSESQLIYHPIHVFEYSCSSQKSAKGSSYNITSRGLVAMDDASQDMIDVEVKTGIHPSFRSTLSVLKYYQSNLQNIHLDERTIIKQTKLAPRLAKKEAIKRLAETIELKIKVVEGRRSIRVGGAPISYDVKGERTLKPRLKDIEILNQDRVYYPFWSIIFTYNQQDFRRIINAVTGDVISDAQIFCESCNTPIAAFCLYCGAPLCRKHVRSCVTCGQNICSRESCGKTSGRILKKTYCASCISSS